MEVRDCEFIVSLRYSHDRVPLCCCQSNYKLGSRDYLVSTLVCHFPGLFCQAGDSNQA